MTLLLTGGTGYLGGRLARALKERGERVRLLVRDPARARGLAAQGFELATGDLAAGTGLAEAVVGCDSILHTAALVKNWSPRPVLFESTNVGGTWALAEAALSAGVRRFVYTSSFFALGPSRDGRPVDESALDAPPPPMFFNDYHSTKYRAARHLRALADRGLPLIILFPTVIFGPGAETDGNHVSRILRMVQRRSFPGLIGGGAQRWNLAWIDDVVAGHLAALDRGLPGRSYVLGGEDHALKELLAHAAARFQVPVVRRSLGYGLCHAIATLEELKARLTGLPPQLTHGEVETYRHDWIYSSERAVAELGYRMTPGETALDRTIDWLKAGGEASR